MSYKAKILDLEDGEEYYIELVDESGALIKRTRNFYLLYEIPPYGGEPKYSGSYSLREIDKLITALQNFT